MSRRLDSAALRSGVVDINCVLALVMEKIGHSHCPCVYIVGIRRLYRRNKS